MAISGGDGSIVLTTKIDESGLKKGLGSIKNLGATAGKAFLAISVAAGAATVAITKMAVSAYADYEQLVGGVETLFKGSAKKVLDYANDAFFTAGVSANEYMRQVTSFSASLISSTAGDTEKAADIANMALIDISDNVNKMGSSMESVTLAYQGFAKQQYMLLDNLKLGYGGTKTEMERLLKDAEALTGVQYDISNLGDVYNAIHAIQEELGITGTTAKEAEKTITGSANMMKAAWENVLVTIAGGGNWDAAINNLVYSIEKYFENIVPVVERSLIGIGTLIERVAPTLVQNVVSALIQSIPSLLNAVYRMIIGLAKGIKQGIIALFSGKTGTTQAIINSGSSMGNVFDKVTDSTEESANNIYDISDALDKAEKEAKKSLATFDDLQILTSQKEEQPEFEFSLPEDSVVDSSQNQQKTAPSLLSPVLDTIKADILAFLPFIEIGLVVIGLLLISFGQIGWGIGFIAAGAYLYSVSERSVGGGFDFSIIQQDLNAILPYIDEALVAIGLILMFLGQVPIGIGFIIAGAIVYGAQEVFTEDYSGEDVITKLAVITEAVSISLVAIGIVLMFFGNFPLGLGFIVAGAGLLKVSEEKLNESAIQTKIQKFFNDFKEYIETAAWAMVALGFVLLLFGNFGLGFALIIGGLGIVGVTEAVLDFDALIDKVKEACYEIKMVFLETVNTVIGWLNAIGLNIDPLGTVGKTDLSLPNDFNYILGTTGMNPLFKEQRPGWGHEVQEHWKQMDKLVSEAVNGQLVPPASSVTENKNNIPIVSDVVDLVSEVVSRMNTGNNTTEVVLEVDGREFGRAVVEQGGIESRRIGTRMVLE